MLNNAAPAIGIIAAASMAATTNRCRFSNSQSSSTFMSFPRRRPFGGRVPHRD
jgi:hypothetical protein